MPSAVKDDRSGTTTVTSSPVLFVFFVAGFAVYLRDQGFSVGLILVMACVAAGMFEMRSVKAIVKYVLFVSISVFFREIESIGATRAAAGQSSAILLTPPLLPY